MSREGFQALLAKSKANIEFDKGTSERLRASGYPNLRETRLHGRVDPAIEAEIVDALAGLGEQFPVAASTLRSIGTMELGPSSAAGTHAGRGEMVFNPTVFKSQAAAEAFAETATSLGLFAGKPTPAYTVAHEFGHLAERATYPRDGYDDWTVLGVKLAGVSVYGNSDPYENTAEIFAAGYTGSKKLDGDARALYDALAGSLGPKKAEAFNPSQPRDARGRWSRGGLAGFPNMATFDVEGLLPGAQATIRAALEGLARKYPKVAANIEEIRTGSLGMGTMAQTEPIQMYPLSQASYAIRFNSDVYGDAAAMQAVENLGRDFLADPTLEGTVSHEFGHVVVATANASPYFGRRATDPTFKSVSPYGKTDWSEGFAELFSAAEAGKRLTPGQKKALDTVVAAAGGVAEALVEYSAGQPRVPAGSPRGGQWAPKGGGWTGGADDLFRLREAGFPNLVAVNLSGIAPAQQAAILGTLEGLGRKYPGTGLSSVVAESLAPFDGAATDWNVRTGDATMRFDTGSFANDATTAAYFARADAVGIFVGRQTLERVAAHEFGHVLTAQTVSARNASKSTSEGVDEVAAVKAAGASVKPVSRYGGQSGLENIAEAFASQEFGPRLTKSQKAMLDSVIGPAVESVIAEYVTSQPRVPAGSPRGGQWSPQGAVAASLSANAGALARLKTVMPNLRYMNLPDSIREPVVGRLTALAQKYPETAKLVSGVGIGNTGTNAAQVESYDGREQRQITYSDRFSGDPGRDAILGRFAAYESYNAGPPTIEGITTHEFGHIVDRQAISNLERSGLTSASATIQGLQAIRDRAHSGSLYPAPGDTGLLHPISGLASEGDAGQWFAEAFTTYEYGGNLTTRQRTYVEGMTLAAENKIGELKTFVAGVKVSESVATQPGSAYGASHDRSDPADLWMLRAARSHLARRVPAAALRSLSRRRARADHPEQGRSPRGVPGRRREGLRSGEGPGQPVLRPEALAEFSPSQPRDRRGRWSAGGGFAAGSGEWTASLSDAERGALYAWTGRSGLRLSDRLRHGGATEPLQDRDVEVIDAAIGRSVFEKPRTLYRGMDAEDLPLSPDKMVGTSMIDRSYVSTSFDRDTALAFSFSAASTPVLLDVNVAAGQHGAFLGELTQHSGEGEVLLARGSKFTFTAHRKIGGTDVLTVTLEEA